MKNNKHFFIICLLYLLSQNIFSTTLHTSPTGNIGLMVVYNGYDSEQHKINVDNADSIKLTISMDMSFYNAQPSDYGYISCEIWDDNYNYYDYLELYTEQGPESLYLSKTIFVPNNVNLYISLDGSPSFLGYVEVEYEAIFPPPTVIAEGDSWWLGEFNKSFYLSKLDANGYFDKDNALKVTSEDNTLNFKVNNTFKVVTDNGWVEMGPKNDIWCHFYSNRNFIFNKDIYTNGSDYGFSSYNNYDLILKTGGIERARVLKSNGSLGIGTSNPDYKLHVVGDVFSEGELKSTSLLLTGYEGLKLTHSNSQIRFHGESGHKWSLGSTGAPGDNFILYDNSQSKVRFIVDDQTGDVGIGTTATNGYKLAVNGTIGAGEVIIENPGDWADFVFNDDYELRTLGELEAFVKANKHLPDIPSEKEVKSSGINVAEMNKLLLQKVEELTLYVIQQQKEIEALKKVVIMSDPK